MVATYTSNLRFTLQGDNDNPNTWGDVLNTVLGLVEEAVGGVADIDVTGSSNVTLSTSNGATDEARHAVLDISGVVTTDIDLVLPAVEKIYVFETSHTGGTVTLKPSGAGSGIDIVTNDKGIVYTNGSSITLISLNPLNSSNDLSDLASASTARDNLGLGELATLDAGSGLEIDGSDLNVTISSSIVGEIRMWSTGTAPSGWEFCDGTTLSRTTYSGLFGVIGTTFGEGDGSTTFNLPDFKGRSPIGVGQGDTAQGGGTGTDRSLGDEGGAETHQLTIAEMPAHDHEGTKTRVKNIDTPQQNEDITDGSTRTGMTGGDQPHNNMHPFLAINFIIYTGV